MPYRCVVVNSHPPYILNVTPAGLLENNRLIFTLLLALGWLVVQTAGLHFHVHDSVDSQELLTTAEVHVDYSEQHTTSHKDGRIDLLKPAIWKNPDYGWDVLALAILGFVLLLSIVTRRISGMPFYKHLPFSRSIYLRPPLRAPPR
jgi:hypothetical protein